MKKKILYIDMDGVLADFDKALESYDSEINNLNHENDAGQAKIRNNKVDMICEANENFFHEIPPINSAIENVTRLFEKFDIYFLSTPMWNAPHSFTGKRIWIEKHFGEMASKRLILTHRKDLNIGEYIIDDRICNGVEHFTGTHIHFGSDEFPNWEIIARYLINNN
ncbi:5' nucleotidase, NT5C type [Flavobacterium faecale]|uniref:5' nucleotidase, NT5C type n=1 Tax=Flavobacterium faecale TaxID=1355330 RepID=UPI003AAABA84